MKSKFVVLMWNGRPAFILERPIAVRLFQQELVQKSGDEMFLPANRTETSDVSGMVDCITEAGGIADIRFLLPDEPKGEPWVLGMTVYVDGRAG